MNSSCVTVDFVAKGDVPEEFQLVLVEVGPLHAPYEEGLRRIQDRLFGCVEAVLNGEVGRKFPESIGKVVVIKLECFNSPVQELQAFFERFATGIFLSEDYKAALHNQAYASGIVFRQSFKTTS